VYFLQASKVAGCIVLMSEQQRRLEQLVLHVRALHILSTSLQLAKEEVDAGRLHPTNAVKTGENAVIRIQ